MPGVSILCSTSPDRYRFSSTLDELLFFDHYFKELLYKGDTITIGYTGYDSYPIQTFETESHVIVVEGHLYAAESIRDVVTSVVDSIDQDQDEDIGGWLAERDGEFLVIAIEKDEEGVYVLNDALGRLPYYTLATEDHILISRELGFLLEYTEVEMDPMGVAQMLLFGYPLGDRTLYKDITQVGPGSLVTATNKTVTCEQMYRLRLDQKVHRDRTVEENAEHLATLFSRSCKRRSDLGGTNVVSLSGGLDSRAIAACFSENDLPFVATTYNKSDGSRSDEVTVAEEVMDVLGGQWKQFDLPPNTGKQMSKLLRMKRGMNFLAMGYILGYFEKIVDEFGSDVQYFAGDGGDKIFPPLGSKQFSDVEAVADHLLASQSRFDVETVTELTGYTRPELKTTVLDRIQSYPGNDLTNKYAQFLFWERGGKWVLHGEDRNRYFFWTPAPFYSLPLVEYAMGVPDEQKKRNKLYRAMLRTLSPGVVGVKYANTGSPIDSIEYKLKRISYDIISRYPSLRDGIVNLIKGKYNYEYDEKLADVFRSQEKSWDDTQDLLSLQKMFEIAENRDKYDRTPVYNLLTVTTAMELSRDGETSLDERHSIQFN